MLSELHRKWTELYGSEKAKKLIHDFQHLAKHLDENGAVIFAALLPTRNFESLVKRYNALLAGYGSKTWIHTYINLANHPDFLADQELNVAFLHPLLIALISHRIGGPVRTVDARGEDAHPMSVLAQDNMLHIDNTPFNDEYKVLLTWEKDKASGPKRQNQFVFLPGTHKGCRNIASRRKECGPHRTPASSQLPRESIRSLHSSGKCVDHPSQWLLKQLTLRSRLPLIFNRAR